MKKYIPADLMPRKVKKSTVLLTVKNVPWNEETRCFVAGMELDSERARREPSI